VPVHRREDYDAIRRNELALGDKEATEAENNGAPGEA